MAPTDEDKSLLADPIDPAQQPQVGPLMYQCQGCWKVLSSASQLQACSRCRLARYCGRECQVKSWKTHKKVCLPLDQRVASHPGIGFSLADLQLYTTIHREALNEAPVHAMGLFNPLEPVCPPDEWFYLVTLKFEPSMRGVDPAKLFSFVSAAPIMMEMAAQALPNLDINDMKEKRRKYVEQAGGPIVYFVAITCSGLINMKPYAVRKEQAGYYQKRWMPDPVVWLREQLPSPSVT